MPCVTLSLKVYCLVHTTVCMSCKPNLNWKIITYSLSFCLHWYPKLIEFRSCKCSMNTAQELCDYCTFVLVHSICKLTGATNYSQVQFTVLVNWLHCRKTRAKRCLASWCWGELVFVRMFMAELSTHWVGNCLYEILQLQMVHKLWWQSPTHHACTCAQLTSDLCVHVLQCSTKYSVVQKIECFAVQWNRSTTGDILNGFR